MQSPSAAFPSIPRPITAGLERSLYQDFIEHHAPVTQNLPFFPFGKASGRLHTCTTVAESLLCPGLSMSATQLCGQPSLCNVDFCTFWNPEVVGKVVQFQERQVQVCPCQIFSCESKGNNCAI